MSSGKVSPLRRVLCFFLGASTTSCHTAKLVGTGPHLTSDPAPPGLHYYLGKDVLAVDATITSTARVVMTPVDTSDARLELAITTESTASIATKTVADAREYYCLNIEPAGLKEQTLTIAVSDEGLLTSADYSSKDKTAEALANVAKGVASVAGTFVGAAIRPLGAPLPAPEQDPPNTLRVSTIFAMTKQGKGAAGEAKDLAYAAFRRHSPAAMYFIAQSAEGLAAFDEREEAFLQVVLIEDKLRANRLTDETDQTKLEAMSKQSQRFEAALTAATARHETAKTIFQALLDRFAAQYGIAPTRRVEHAVYVLDLTELPLPEDVDAQIELRDRAAGGAGMPAAAAQTRHYLALPGQSYPALLTWLRDTQKFTRAAELFERTGIVVTLSKSQDPHVSRGQAPEKDDARARIYYRVETPHVVRTYALTSRPNPATSAAGLYQERLTPCAEQMLSLMRPDSQARFVAYDPKLFADQRLVLGFNTQGRLVRVTQENSAGAAAAAAGIAGAISAARDEYAGSLSKVRDIRSTAYQIGLNDLQYSIDSAKKHKDLVDAQVALQGAQSSSALLLQKSAADAQLALLQSQLALAKAQGSYDLQLQQSSSDAQVQLLRSQVSLLQQQIDLLTQRKALEDLQAKTP